MRPEFLSLSRSGKQRFGAENRDPKRNTGSRSGMQRFGAENRDSERKQEDKMGKYFGTDGYRGEANVNLTADDAFKVGKFLAYYFSEKGYEAFQLYV